MSFRRSLSIHIYYIFIRVADADDMFNMTLERLQSFPKTRKARDLCICEKPSLSSGTIKNTLTCTNAKGLISCDKDKMKPAQKDVCYERHNRRKRSAKHSFTFMPKIVIEPKLKRSKVLFLQKYLKHYACLHVFHIFYLFLVS